MEQESIPLSHSSAGLLLECEQRYVHHKVLKTKPDPDYVKSDALAVGSAFHWILEKSRHEKPKSITEDLEHCVMDEDILLPEEEMPLVHAMVLKYLRLHQASGFKVLEVETELKTEMFHGFVDAIVEDPMGFWYILDLKTYKTLNPASIRALTKDPQLNLYAAHAPLLAKIHNLDEKRFGGCRWRVVTKSSAKQKASESTADYVMRLVEKHLSSYDLTVPVAKLSPAERAETHRALWEKTKELKTRPPIRNYKNCLSYFSPCPHWSQCYGKTFSEMEGDVIVTEGP